MSKKKKAYASVTDENCPPAVVPLTNLDFYFLSFDSSKYPLALHAKRKSAGS